MATIMTRTKDGKRSTREVQPCYVRAYLADGWQEVEVKEENAALLRELIPPSMKTQRGKGALFVGEGGKSATAADKSATADEKPAPAKPAKTAKERAEARASEAGE